MRVALIAVVSIALACDSPRAAVRTAATHVEVSTAVTGVRLVPAPVSGDVASVVRAATLEARREGRTLLVYVGAVWCEPCGYFHRAAERGALDHEFPGLTVLEFDLDRDAARLRDAGYLSRMIPLFTVPAEDGRASDRRFEGSIHGEAAVGDIAGRLRALLATHAP